MTARFKYIIHKNRADFLDALEADSLEESKHLQFEYAIDIGAVHIYTEAAYTQTEYLKFQQYIRSVYEE